MRGEKLMADLFAYLEGFGTGESFTKSIIIVTDLPTGSTVTATKGGTVKTAAEKNGEWWIKNLDLGEWILKATLGEQSATTTFNIEKFGVHYVPMSFQLYPDDFDWSEMGTKGVDYEIVQDDDTPIPVEDYRKYKNWKARILTSGFVTAQTDGYIDVFTVGGGGGAHFAGAGSGYTNTQKQIKIIKGTRYELIVGSGGNPNQKGGATSAFGVTSEGGNPPKYSRGGDGASGGGSAYDEGERPEPSQMNGGTDGSDGFGDTKGIGQGSTTREFGEPDGRLYAGGGAGAGEVQSGKGGEPEGGDGSSSQDGKPGGENTGSGGGGSYLDETLGGPGGSGIIVFRNTREVS